jgi:hypothetical protein
LLLHQQLLSLLISKGLFTRDEILEHIESALLAAEEMNSTLDAARRDGADELSMTAVRAHLESLRITLEIRHPERMAIRTRGDSTHGGAGRAGIC